MRKFNRILQLIIEDRWIKVKRDVEIGIKNYELLVSNK